MITYEFQCVYGHIVERKMSINDDTRTIACDACGEDALRIMSRNANHPIGLPTKVHHKPGSSGNNKGPIDLGEIE